MEYVSSPRAVEIDFNQSCPSVFLIQENFFSFFGKDNLPEWAEQILDFAAQWFDASPFLEANTSGTTGEPKTIRILKQKMINSACLTGDILGLSPGQSALLCLSPQFIAGKMMLVRSFVLRLRLIMIRPSAEPMLGMTTPVDFAAMTPHQAESLTGKKALFKVLIIGGGGISQYLQTRLQKMEGRIYITYGMTETVSHVALQCINGPNPDNCFKALPGVEFSQNDQNCLRVRAPALAEKEQVTHDIVELKDKYHFKFVGRADHMINSGGIKVSPERLEKQLSNLLKHPFFISSLPDLVYGERIILCLEIQEMPHLKELFEKIKDVLPPYQQPKAMYRFCEFIRTPTGKINRKKTMERINLQDEIR